MKNKLKYLFVALLSFNFLKAQVKHFDFNQGCSQLFNGNVFSFGLSDQKQNAVFSIYKLDFQLKTLDSLIIELGKSKFEDYLQIYSDTLHDYLNIYLQKKERKAVTVLRFSKKFEKVATINNVDVARLNNTSLFSEEMLYFKNVAYSVKTESDTSGKQFYLNKYQLKNDSLNFDYQFKWQFPFERKNIHSAHVFFANKNYVFLFVHVNGGVRTGQWILKLNAESGKLEKATKLNDKAETNIYFFGDFLADKNYKSLHLIGQKFSAAQFNLKENKQGFSNAPFSTIYCIEIDSLGEVKTKQDFKIPINDIKTSKAGIKKGANSYLLRFDKLAKSPDGSISFGADIFKNSNSGLCFLYSNTSVFNLVPAEDKLVLEKNDIRPNLLVEDYYFTQDKLDMNGRVCVDSLSQFEKLFYKPLAFPVKSEFKFDAEKNPIWILTKHTNKRNTVNFSFLSPVKKIYQLTTIEEISETNNPIFKGISIGSFLISSQIEPGKYQLKLYPW